MLAESFSVCFNSGPWGRACGLLHDIGKASALFQLRVRGETERKVDHSTAGARQASEAWKDVGKLLAYCIAGHHSGLPDGQSNDESSLAHRLDPERRKIEKHDAWRACLGAKAEILPPASVPFDPKGKLVGFSLAFFLRMLFSCLVDADRLDAESVGDTDRAALRGAYPALAELADRLDRHLAKFSADTPVRRIRAEVLASCRAAAELFPGLFSLTVPTGGGKTLSSLAFALGHAQCHGLSRVVYVIPYTSIIEQNAAVFRKALGDECGEFVVEHHSNLVPPEKDSDGDSAKADDRPHPATENWDAPVIVTTAVQFFESLYSHKAGRCRKLHNLAKSVIILDEAQMLPLRYLLPCIEALRELTATYGASVVLCTATQPALNASDDGSTGLKGGLTGVREIMPDPVALHASLKRVQVQHLGELADAELAKGLAGEPQVLCIVNTRRQARRLFEALRSGADTPDGLFHLSALMCPQHRTGTLERIREAIAGGRPCRVVSTTLVEAGVDVDFPVVYRAEGGIDNIA
ncbi:MAG: CRISPR-associated endonuclease Cas3'', partial [Desulfovibrio sp.]|nr:CRISPR-associated endonuclease Cas3'' [Desulfovibrio sp.]